MKPLSLSGRKTCDVLLRKGMVWKGKHFVIRWLPGAPRKPAIDAKIPAVYLGTFASTKLSKLAVERNRMRRRCREAIRLALLDYESFGPVQLLLCPRIASLQSPFDVLLQEVRTFLSSLPTWRNKAHPAVSPPASLNLP